MNRAGERLPFHRHSLRRCPGPVQLECIDARGVDDAGRGRECGEAALHFGTVLGEGGGEGEDEKQKRED